MSLLMDALKKAELAKRQGSTTGELSLAEPEPALSLSPVEAPAAPEAAAPTQLSLETTPPAADRESRFPTLPERLEELDEQFLAHHRQESLEAKAKRPAPPEIAVARPRQPEPPAPPAPPPIPPTPQRAPAPPPPPVPDNKPEQEAIKNVFAAKGPPAGKNRLFAIGIGVTTLLAALAIGGYFWWQLQPKSGLMPAQGSFRPAPPAAPMPVATAPAVPTSAVPPAPTITIPPANSPTDTPTGAEEEAEQAPIRPTPLRRPVAVAPPPIPADSPVQITRAPLRVHPSIARGYALFERGELAAARMEYERALKSDPQNVDALHGMAAISLRENRLDAADHYFQRVLIADPQDAHAIAGMANLRGRINPAAAESRLRTLVNDQPEIAAPQFALGNLYASQERWNEAQQAYFKAYSVEPGNPDILFNLAISLEHLGQARLAAQYYTLAVAAAAQRPSAFDPALAAARLRALQQP